MALIAGELNVELPNVDIVKLEKFITDTEEIHSNSRTSAEEKVYYQRNNREYPWTRRVLEYNGKLIYDYSTYLEIQKILKVADSLPINRASRIILMLFQTSQKEYDFNWHFDSDTQYGFRVCFGLDKSIPFVHLTKLKPEYEHVSKTFERIESHMVYEDIQYDLYPTKENTVFMLNRKIYPHKVPVVENSKMRCVIIIQGELMESNLDFLQRIDDELYSQ